MKASHLNMIRATGMLLVAAIVLAACSPAPTASPTSTSAPPAIAPTATALPPSATPVPPTTTPVPPTATVIPTSAPKISTLDFRSAMRKLWEDHVTWTRLYIVSVAADLPDKDLTAQRLLQNQTDIGNAIKPYYGDKAGDALTALLKDHILGAADLLVA